MRLTVVCLDHARHWKRSPTLTMTGTPPEGQEGPWHRVVIESVTINESKPAPLPLLPWQDLCRFLKQLHDLSVVNTAKTSRPSITLWGREMKSPLKRLSPKANHFPQTPMLKWLLINCNCRHFRKKSGRNLCCDASLRSRGRGWWKKSVSEWIICKVTSCKPEQQLPASCCF